MLGDEDEREHEMRAAESMRTATRVAFWLRKSMPHCNARRSTLIRGVIHPSLFNAEIAEIAGKSIHEGLTSRAVAGFAGDMHRALAGSQAPTDNPDACGSGRALYIAAHRAARDWSSAIPAIPALIIPCDLCPLRELAPGSRLSP